jgi:hypothetical protein
MTDEFLAVGHFEGDGFGGVGVSGEEELMAGVDRLDAFVGDLEGIGAVPEFARLRIREVNGCGEFGPGVGADDVLAVLVPFADDAFPDAVVGAAFDDGGFTEDFDDGWFGGGDIANGGSEFGCGGVRGSVGRGEGRGGKDEKDAKD